MARKRVVKIVCSAEDSASIYVEYPRLLGLFYTAKHYYGFSKIERGKRVWYWREACCCIPLEDVELSQWLTSRLSSFQLQERLKSATRVASLKLVHPKTRSEEA